MSETKRILTVSFGAFSCTLEGYEDPLSTLMPVAEYFRALTARDRRFGAPPQPAEDAAPVPPRPHRDAARPVPDDHFGPTARSRRLRSNRLHAQARAAATLHATDPGPAQPGRRRRDRPGVAAVRAGAAGPAAPNLPGGEALPATPSAEGAPRLVRARVTRRRRPGAGAPPTSALAPSALPPAAPGHTTEPAATPTPPADAGQEPERHAPDGSGQAHPATGAPVRQNPAAGHCVPEGAAWPNRAAAAPAPATPARQGIVQADCLSVAPSAADHASVGAAADGGTADDGFGDEGSADDGTGAANAGAERPAVSLARLLREADSQFRNGEAMRRRATIAQLKAAVAAARAEGMTAAQVAQGARSGVALQEAAAEAPFRDDLRRAVRISQAAAALPAASAPAPARAALPPLWLGAAQRVDPLPARGATSPGGPEPPRGR